MLNVAWKCQMFHDLLTITEFLCHKWRRKCSILRNNQPVFSIFMIYYGVFIKCITTGDTSGAGIAYSSGAPKYMPFFSVIRVARSYFSIYYLSTIAFVLFLLVIVFKLSLHWRMRNTQYLKSAFVFFGRREIPSKHVFVGETDHLHNSDLFHFNLCQIFHFHTNFNANDINVVHFLFKI